MPQKDVYITLRCEAEVSFEEKRSRFIGNAAPVKSEEEAAAFVKRISAKYSDATHNVYAYYLGGGAHAKYSDDGEPQGTAGPPVLDIIKKSGGDDIAVVVTRYFGGIKLGAGGLVRAYAEAAKLAIAEAGLAEFRLHRIFTLTVDYSGHRLLNAKLPAAGARIENCDFGENVTITCSARSDRYDAVCALISELGGGKWKPEPKGEKFDISESSRA